MIPSQSLTSDIVDRRSICTLQRKTDPQQGVQNPKRRAGIKSSAVYYSFVVTRLSLRFDIFSFHRLSEFAVELFHTLHPILQFVDRIKQRF